jgi:hypothetical protein
MDGCCSNCGEPIDVRRDYRKVVGYERIHRSAGGTNAVRLPDRTDEYLCARCVDKASSGVALQQASLMELK